MPAPDHDATTPALSRIHETRESEAPIELIPPHPPRTETPIYQRTHHRLVVVEDRPCFICGVRKSVLASVARADPEQNPLGATDIETHHFPVERALLAALDRELLARDYPTVHQFKTLEEWVDSEYNMLVLCDQCHRLAPHAIHRAHYDAFIAEKYGKRDAQGHRYEFAAEDEQQAKQLEAVDALILAANAEAQGEDQS